MTSNVSRALSDLCWFPMEGDVDRAEVRRAVEILFRHADKAGYRNELGGFYWRVEYNGLVMTDGGNSGPDVTREYADAVRRRFVRFVLTKLREMA
jgi:hypothetical protein